MGFARVIAYDPFASEAKAAALNVKLVSFDEALATGDFFSLHMPLTPDTKARAAWLVGFGLLVRYARSNVTRAAWLCRVKGACALCPQQCDIPLELRGSKHTSRSSPYKLALCCSAVHPAPRRTQGIFGDAAFAKIKRGARVINVARGGVIDDAALARALDSGAVAQAALDVFTQVLEHAPLKVPRHACRFLRRSSVYCSSDAPSISSKTSFAS